MAKSSREFVIPFVGLKLGAHEFEFEIDTSFFEAIEYSIIQEGKVHARLSLQKKETMMIGDFFIEGVVTKECDRCTDPLEVEIEGNYQLVFKFGTDLSDDESLIVLPNEAYELDVRPYFYELITVSLPHRSVHPQGECNEEILDKLGDYLVNPGDEDEDEWDEEDEDWEDSEEWDDEDENADDSDEDSEGGEDPDAPIDPRWSILKNLN